MSVNLPTGKPGSTTSEVAAQSTSITRTVQLIGGKMTPVFSAAIAYTRTDYFLDETGSKVAILSTGNDGPMDDPSKRGYIGISPEKLMALFVEDPKFAEAFQYVSDVEDRLIREDLIARGIL